ncbi:MAG TPA: metallophosphoesterase [Acidobacteriota bacterium]|nr:metallophosphoesterase [Acidobacteriota bacterium]
MSKLDSTAIVAVGDVHGELNALREILRHAGILGDQDQWIGGSAILVQTGDIIDRGPDSLGVYKLLEKLQFEAARTGGAVVRLLGNHELALLKEKNCMTDVPDWHSFRRMLEHDVLTGKVRGAYAGQGYLFTHAGIRSEIREYLLEGQRFGEGRDITPVLADKINCILIEAVKSKNFLDRIFQDDAGYRGGHRVGGIFWTRSVFSSENASKVAQVFGHTIGKDIRRSPSERRVDIDVGIHCYGGRAYLTLRGGIPAAHKIP